jgi:hypothetical protein
MSDNSRFVTDLTIPDDTPIAAGTKFVKTWRIENNGTTTWSAAYRLAFVSGDSMGAATSQPLPTAVSPGQQIDISVELTAPATPGTYFCDWLLQNEQGFQFGDIMFARIVVPTGETTGTTPVSTTPVADDQPAVTRLQTGMNINPDAPNSNPLADGELRGLDWVRFVFKLAARVNEAERDDINAAFAQYDSLIKGYDAQGVKSLIVLNQETVWGIAPWTGNNNWSGFADQFAGVAGQIARQYRDFGDRVAYEIWNEGDLPNNPASVFVPPAQFAVVLQKTAAAIREAAPTAPLVFGGMATGPAEGIAYVKGVMAALNGSLPVDAIGIHPYGRWGTKAPFDWGQQFGTLGQAFADYQAALPGFPLWITEIGVAADGEIGPQFYQEIGEYFINVHETVAAQHVSGVPVLIWFAWSDWMRNAGIVQRDGSRKQHVFDAFKKIRERDF